MKLRNLYVLVKDTDRAIKFYTDILGFELHRKQDRYSILKLDDFWFGLLNESFEKNNVIRGNNCIPVFKVKDVEKEFARLKDAGVNLNQKEISILPDVKLFQFTDTEGNILEMYEEQEED